MPTASAGDAAGSQFAPTELAVGAISEGSPLGSQSRNSSCPLFLSDSSNATSSFPPSPVPSYSERLGEAGRLAEAGRCASHGSKCTNAASGSSAAAASAGGNSSREDATLAAEIRWLVDSECAEVLGHVRQLLQRCVASLAEDRMPTARSAQLRGGNTEDGMLVAVVVGSTALHAMRVQVDFPNWNSGVPYTGMLYGGQRASLTIPALLRVHNRVAQALASCTTAHGSTATARAATQQTLSLVADAVRTLSLSDPLGLPTSLAPALTDMMQPPMPPGVVLDATISSEPPRLVLSAYLLQPGADGGIAEAKHAPVYPDAFGERLDLLHAALREARGLMTKLEVVS